MFLHCKKKTLSFLICCRETAESGLCSYLLYGSLFCLPGFLQFIKHFYTSYLGVVTTLPIGKRDRNWGFSQDHTASCMYHSVPNLHLFPPESYILSTPYWCLCSNNNKVCFQNAVVIGFSFYVGIPKGS